MTKEELNFLTSQSDQEVAALKFERDEQYTTFTAEYAVDGDDLVFHFYRSPEIEEAIPSDHYWRQQFPEALSEVAQEMFQAGYPRLKAAFTPEKDSWWMRANGFANVGLPAERVAAFYTRLDQALEAVKNK